MRYQTVSNTYTLQLQDYLNLTIKTNMSKYQAISAPRAKQRIMGSNLDPRSSRWARMPAILVRYVVNDIILSKTYTAHAGNLQSCHFNWRVNKHRLAIPGSELGAEQSWHPHGELGKTRVIDWLAKTRSEMIWSPTNSRGAKGTFWVHNRRYQLFVAFICFIYYSIVTLIENGEVQLNNWVGRDRTRDLRRSGT